MLFSTWQVGIGFFSLLRATFHSPFSHEANANRKTVVANGPLSNPSVTQRDGGGRFLRQAAQRYRGTTVFLRKSFISRQHSPTQDFGRSMLQAWSWGTNYPLVLWRFRTVNLIDETFAVFGESFNESLSMWRQILAETVRACDTLPAIQIFRRRSLLQIFICSDCHQSNNEGFVVPPLGLCCR